MAVGYDGGGRYVNIIVEVRKMMIGCILMTTTVTNTMMRGCYLSNTT